MWHMAREGRGSVEFPSHLVILGVPGIILQIDTGQLGDTHKKAGLVTQS